MCFHGRNQNAALRIAQGQAVCVLFKLANAYSSMPRVTTSTHPLVALRAACGMTRAQAATVAGVSPASIQHVELGRSALPLAAARKLEAFTGCDASTLMDSAAKPRSLDGQAFTGDRWRSWSNRGPDQAAIAAAADDLGFRLHAYLGASGAGFWTFYTALVQSLGECAENARISPAAVEAECRKSAAMETRTMTISQLRVALGRCPDFEQQVAGFRPRQRCRVATETYRVVPNDEHGREVAAMVVPHAVTLPHYRREVATLWRVELPDGRRVQWRPTEFQQSMTGPRKR
ncbi:MAG: helix-turn-helix domain-containing protein [Chthoniobacterales bacterium]